MLFCLVLAVLKKNYARLWHCLPQDYIKTIDILKQQLGNRANILTQAATNLPTADLINQTIVGVLITGVTSDIASMQLCDTMENLVDDEYLRRDIEVIRNGKF